MPVRSMTGYAQLTHQVNDRTSFSLSLKSVNHRFLDLHFRIPIEATALELKMRRLLKEKIARGHIEVSLSLQHGDSGGFQLNHALVEGYVRAFQEAAERLGIVSQPDLNVILRVPGALSGDSATLEEATEQIILSQLELLIERLNHMREEEGRGVDRELRERMEGLSHAVSEIGKLRVLVSRAYLEKVQSRMNELIAGHVDPDRVLQEPRRGVLLEIKTRAHRPADIHEQAHLQRQIGLASERYDRLDRLVIIKEIEIVLTQISDEFAVLIRRDEQNVHFVHAFTDREN